MRSLEADQDLLFDVLAEVMRASGAPDTLTLDEQTADLARQARRDGAAGDELADLVAGLALPDARDLVRSLVSYFQLVNLAEDNERLRRLRARERDASAGDVRRGSMRAAVQRLRERGAGPGDVAELLSGAEIRLVLTAHPTEARRRTVVEKLARVFGVIHALDRGDGLPADEAQARRRLLTTVQELWGSDELRAVSPTVLDEVRGGLLFFVTTLADVVPVFYRDLEEALGEAYPGERVDVPPLLTFGSWMGGDRDGNPGVTPAVTAETLALMRDQCLRFLAGRVELLAGRVSLSERVSGHPDLDRVLAEGAERFGERAAALAQANPEEPYRRALSLMTERVRATRRGQDTGYGGPGELLADLRAVADALRSTGGAYAAAGDLRDVIRQVEVFGFHFARLDVRDHARRHRAALDEVITTLGVDGAEALRDPGARSDLLCRLVADPRPLVPGDVSGFSEQTQEVIGTFRMLDDVLRGAHRGAVETYVVSGTETPADLLNVLLLMKEATLTRAGGHGARLRIVPLFEAGDTLAAAPETMSDLIGRAEYRAALDAVGGEQEVMVGYSDSNKDVGYTASGWATYRAQTQVAEVLRAAGLSWSFFHGRGGAIGRGGGPTNAAIDALPPSSVVGRIKLTEQGEVLATKYSVEPIAHRELELTASAVLAGALRAPDVPTPEQRRRFEAVMEQMAAVSARAYRALVHDDPEFAAFFHAVTPVDEISRLRLGSRPARRSAGGGIDELRAIPWVFSWTQTRIVLPAWYGLGSALRAAREEHGEALLCEMRDDWPFFATLLANAEMACAKADLRIGRRYVELWDDEAPRERIWSAISGEFALTSAELVAIGGNERLLDDEPVLRASIDRRNPYVDPLSFVQVDLLRRLRAGESDEDLGRLTLLTINGIASGLRNTG